MGTSAAGLRRIVTPLLEAVLAPHGPDRYLELINPLWSLHQVRARIVEIRRHANASVTLLLRPNTNWRGFQAGQHVAFTVDIDGVLRTRCYSPACSAYSANLLEITVAVRHDGLVSGYLHAAAVPGTVVRLSQAQGRFVLPPTRPEHVVLISGGSGITPVMSMLRTLCDEGFCAADGPGRVTFLHYARSADHVPYQDELAALAAAHPRLRLLRSYTRDSGGECAGRFRPNHLPSLGADTAAWVCGPAGLIEAVRAHWDRTATAIPLHSEQFTPPAPAPPILDHAPYGEVSFSRSARQVPNTGASLLEQAEAAGIQPAFGCRMGICLTCTARKIHGSVRHRYTGQLHTEPDTDIQICSTTPIGNVTVDL